VFGWLQAQGNLDTRELTRTFNSGIGMVLVAANADADKVIASLQASGEKPVVIGVIEQLQKGGDGVRLSGKLAFGG
jgi:phosphoribosylformylglycinamidine cyclo-ligase